MLFQYKLLQLRVVFDFYVYFNQSLIDSTIVNDSLSISQRLIYLSQIFLSPYNSHLDSHHVYQLINCLDTKSPRDNIKL